MLTTARMSGCGGGGTSSSGGAFSSDGGGGSSESAAVGDIVLTFDVSGTTARAAEPVPPTSTRFRIHVVNPATGRDVIDPVVVDRIGEATQEVVVKGVPVGEQRVRVEFLDDGGAIVGYASSALNVAQGGTVAQAVSSSVGIESVLVTPASATISGHRPAA